MQNRFQVQGTVGENGTVGPVTGQSDTQSYHTAKYSKCVVLHSELYLKVCFCFLLLGIFVGALQVIYSLRDHFMQVVVYFQKHFPSFPAWMSVLRLLVFDIEIELLFWAFILERFNSP